VDCQNFIKALLLRLSLTLSIFSEPNQIFRDYKSLLSTGEYILTPIEKESQSLLGAFF
jgi:hypothetical protein